MYRENSYKYEKDGIVYVSKNVPEGAIILKTLPILIAEEGYELLRISDNERVGSSIWLRDGDSQENYREVEEESE